MYCNNCGKEINLTSKFCKFCGTKNSLSTSEKDNELEKEETVWTCDYCGREFDTKKLSDEHEKFCQLNPNNIIKSKAENTSGMGENTVFPPEIKGWSWGGFLFSWIWSIGNKTWIGLLAIIPYVGFIMNIVLGVKGREWAWKNKKWESVEQFKKIQKRWAIWGLVLGVFPLLAILSVAILATINPIEQTNKARDASVKNDSAELLNAFERYYANNEFYPWQSSSKSDSKVLTQINDASWMELIYSSGELQDSFRQKLLNLDNRYVLYNNGVDTFVCFNPKSKDNQDEARTRCTTDIKISGTSLCSIGNELICVP